MKNLKGKINEIIENHSLLIIIVFGFIVSTALTVYTGIRADDKLWNFVNTYKMYNGGTIYINNNVIITPLFFYIGLGLFKVLGANYFTFNIYNIVIWFSFDILVYNLFSTLLTNKKRVVLSTILIILSACLLIPSGANYNFLAVDFVLLGMILNKRIEGKKLNTILQGIISFVVFFSKQNIGAMYIFSLLILNIYKWQKNKDKSYIFVFIKEMLIAGILLFISLGAMYLSGNLEGFLNYAIFGLGEFAQYNTSRKKSRSNRRNSNCNICSGFSSYY